MKAARQDGRTGTQAAVALRAAAVALALASCSVLALSDEARVRIVQVPASSEVKITTDKTAFEHDFVVEASKAASGVRVEVTDLVGAGRVALACGLHSVPSSASAPPGAAACNASRDQAPFAHENVVGIDRRGTHWQGDPRRPWVDWEITKAKELGKRIVGVYERGGTENDIPAAFKKYHDSLVAWNSNKIIGAIQGDYDRFENPDGGERGPVGTPPRNNY